ncbi:MAG: hypothetical protein J5725_09370, partial [Bacteroidales bacterium]|nr:hypothetical protein [Bacteroidales bacterium]
PDQFDAIKSKLKEMGMNAKQTENILKSLGKTNDKSTKKMAGGLSKVAIKFKSLALYRILRLALMKIQQEFTNSIQNLAQVDVGFNDSISQLKSSFKYLSDSIIGALAPLLESITPIIVELADGLADLGNEIGKIFAESMGKDTFSEATKGAEDYAESLKKAKNLTLGIDELNVAKQDDNKNNYQQVDIQGQTDGALSGLKEIAKYIKQIFEPIKKLVKSILPPIMNLLKPIAKLLERVFEIIIPIIEVLVDVLSDILPPIIDMIGEIINFIADLLPTLQPVIDALVNSIKPILDIIFSVLQQIFTTVQPLFAQIIEFIAPIMVMIGNVITQIMNFITPLIQMVADVLAPIIEIIFEVLGKILEVLTPIIEVLFESLQPVLKIVFTLVESIFNTILPIISDVLTPILACLSPILDLVKSIFEFLQPFLEVIIAISNAVIDYLKPAFSNIGSAFAGIKEKIQPLTEWLTNICETWKNLFSAVTSAFKGDWSSAIDYLKKAFAGIINSIIGGFETMLNGVINGINTLLKPVIWFIQKAGGSFSGIPNVSFNRVSFAQGGFVEDGLFFANHNELVGQFSNGQTAVANNEQIIDGIYRGVLQAMKDAGSGNGGEIVVQIDGREIARAVNKHNQTLGGGTNLFKGGVEYGY